MSFQWPLALVGLLVVPALVALYVARERRRSDFAARFTTPALLPNLVDSAPSWRRHLPLALLLLALTAMVVGVARPHAMMSVQREEATVILAIDTSLSMGAQDVKPSRLIAARTAAAAFVAKMPKKFRVGLVGSIRAQELCGWSDEHRRSADWTRWWVVVPGRRRGGRHSAPFACAMCAEPNGMLPRRAPNDDNPI